MFRGVEYDAPVARYYERLAAVQARGSQASHQVLRDILREVHIFLYFTMGISSQTNMLYIRHLLLCLFTMHFIRNFKVTQ